MRSKLNVALSCMTAALVSAMFLIATAPDVPVVNAIAASSNPPNGQSNDPGTETVSVVADPSQPPREYAPSARVVIEGRDLGLVSDLPRPSTMSVHAFEEKLFDFVHERNYQKLGWSVDKTIRDTGPFIKGRAYGTHPAVRVYYSPEVIAWLMNQRRGMIPDGAMIIKEQYHEPAIQHVEKSEEELRESLKSWTVMVKDSKGSHDGWFWSNPYANDANPDRRPVPVNNHEYPFNHPESGFGHYCVRCHAATQSPDSTSPDKDNEFTFSSLRNIQGFPGEPIIFRVDDSWRAALKEELVAAEEVDPENEAKIEASLAEVGTSSSSHPKCTGVDCLNSASYF